MRLPGLGEKDASQALAARKRQNLGWMPVSGPVRLVFPLPSAGAADTGADR